MPELRISTEKVCALIEAAREVAGKVPSTAGDKTTTGDDSELVTIEEPEGIGENEDAQSHWSDGVLEYWSNDETDTSHYSITPHSITPTGSLLHLPVVGPLAWKLLFESYEQRWPSSH